MIGGVTVPGTVIPNQALIMNNKLECCPSQMLLAFWQQPCLVWKAYEDWGILSPWKGLVKEFSIWGTWTLLQASTSHHWGCLGKAVTTIFFVLIDYLGSSCKFTAKSRGRCRDFPYTFCSPQAQPQPFSTPPPTPAMWCISHYWWTYIVTSLSPTVKSSHWGSLGVGHSVALDKSIMVILH